MGYDWRRSGGFVTTCTVSAANSDPSKSWLAYLARVVITVVRDRLIAQPTQLKQGEGGAIYLCGCGELAGALLSAGLIDRLILKKAPIVIGEGVRIFGDSSAQTRFKVSDITQHQSGVMTVTMDLA